MWPKRDQASDRAGPTAAECVEVEDAHVQGVPLLQSGPQCAVQPVFEVDVALPLHGMGEQVAVKRGVLVEQLVERQLLAGGDQLVETDCAGWDAGPVAGRTGRDPDRGGLRARP